MNLSALAKHWWPHFVAGTFVALTVALLVIDAVYAAFGDGPFIWQYDVYWTCGGPLSQQWAALQLPAFLAGNLVALVVTPSILLPLTAYLAVVWLQWFLICLAVRRVTRSVRHRSRK